jgi:cobalamin biosynthetic protein CobC
VNLSERDGRAPDILHGGDLAAARSRFPGAPMPWIDLSTGINPRSYPVGTIPDEVWRRLPDAAALAALERAAAAAYGAPPSHQAVAVPGTQAAIQVLPRLLNARHVSVLGFGYEEHPRSWKAAGADVSIVETLADMDRADVAVVVNPNNPDGRFTAPEALAALAHRLASRGGVLVVDEAFMDVCCPALSLVSRRPPPNAVVLRSVGKFFGLAGLRLGFAIADDDLAPRIRAALGPWAVSGPAITIAARALSDLAWASAERHSLGVDAARLDRLLIGAGFEVLGGTPLFRLARSAEAPCWYRRLGRAGILVRPFPRRPAWLRFGLPGPDRDWERLADAFRP